MTAQKVKMNFVVDTPNLVSNREFERVWAMIDDQINSHNDFASIDKISWDAMTEYQQGQIKLRFAAIHTAKPMMIASKDFKFEIFIGPLNAMLAFTNLVQNEYLTRVLLDDAQLFDGRTPNIVYGSTVQASTPRPAHRQLAFGNNQVIFTPNLAITPIIAPPVNRLPNGRRIPRPKNCWIIYRGDKHDEVKKANPGKKNAIISSIIAGMWSSESIEVRRQYAKLAEQEKIQHQARYPTYRYAPRKSNAIKRRRGVARARVLRKEESFAESDEVLTSVQGCGNYVENSASALGGSDMIIRQ